MSDLDLLINFTKELEFSELYTLEQKLDLMTCLTNAIYATNQKDN